MDAQESRDPGTRAELRIAFVLCVAVAVAGVVEHLVQNRPTYARGFAPGWMPLIAAGVAAAGIVASSGSRRWLRVRVPLLWSGLLLMVWAANGLPLDVMRVAGLIPLPVDWPGMATKTLALGAVLVLAHLTLSRSAPAYRRPAAWYGYAAFVLALPYPVLRTHWALGGMLGLYRPGAAGEGWAPWLLAIPWLLAAVLSLLLVPARPRLPRRVLLAAGWFATAIVGMIGPAAVWSLVSALVASGTAVKPAAKGPGIAMWVFAVIYGSWFLWAIAAAAATRSYQLRSADTAEPVVEWV